MKRIKNTTELTPIEEYHGILFKRDDIFLPFNDLTELGGTKVRSMLMLYDSIKNKIGNDLKGLITYSSVSSPQGLITAKIAQMNNLPSIICIGSKNGSVDDSIHRHKSIKYSDELGAEIRIVSKLGYNSVLKPKAMNIASETGYHLVHFGINMNEYPEAIINSISNQVQNIPDNLDNLILTCGSGVTSGGILVGLSKFNKQVKRIIIIQISGYDRSADIYKILEIFNVNYEYEFIIDKTYDYGKNIQHFISPNFDLSVKYEAKAYKYFLNNRANLGINATEKTLFYCIGNNNFIY